MPKSAEERRQIAPNGRAAAPELALGGTGSRPEERGDMRTWRNRLREFVSAKAAGKKRIMKLHQEIDMLKSSTRISSQFRGDARARTPLCLSIAGIAPAVVAALALLGTSARAQVASVERTGLKVDRSLTLTLTPFGFRPNTIAVKPGTIALVLENRSPAPKVTLTLTQDRQTTPALTSRHGPKTADVWHFITIQPGTYAVAVSEHPAWKCTVIVEPK